MGGFSVFGFRALRSAGVDPELCLRTVAVDRCCRTDQGEDGRLDVDGRVEYRCCAEAAGDEVNERFDDIGHVHPFGRVVVEVQPLDGGFVDRRDGGATDQPYGVRQGRIRDPFGHVWAFNAPVANP